MKALKEFRDKHTKKVYKKGDSYFHKDEERVAFLVEKGYVEGDKKPSTALPTNTKTADKNSYQLMTKKELSAILNKKGIEHKRSDTKEKMIELLLGGE